MNEIAVSESAQSSFIDTVRIREMRYADIEAVVEIGRSSQSIHWTFEQFNREVNEIEVSEPIVATLDRRIVGFAVPWYLIDHIDLTNICVVPTFRRKGVATKLMHYIFQKCAAGAYRKVHLEVRESNTGAIAFYKKLGFLRIGFRRRYYPDTKEDAVLMVCEQ